MIEDQAYRWTKEKVRSLRLRLGWSKSELAFRLQCSPQQVEAWEEGGQSIDSVASSSLEVFLHQADACSDEVHYMPAAENQCDQKALEQIDFSRVKADLDN